ncbi:MAG TPA: B-box zinc finger protein [Anaerolineae bacterium]|nr:B-box zinc finger protein [Anaerolineae bacterium]HOQ98122.1 B-box zinc finger protein [Anaerolineae bacterium]HPL28506.1 B-box zinc finger protein [Anaerolineae bacterium]
MGGTPPVAESDALYCANHPAVETLLRCNKCGKPICQRCGIRTPVGIRCRECAQLRRPPMYALGPQHYLLTALVALPASFLAGLVMQQVGPFFAFFLGGAVGGLIAEVVYRATHKRGQGLAWVVSGCILLGALASAGALVFFMPGAPLAALLNPQVLLSLIMRSNVVYVVLAIAAAFARLR